MTSADPKQLPEYPSDILNQLEKRARKEFNTERSPSRIEQNRLLHEPRGHLIPAVDHLFKAAEQVATNNTTQTIKHIAIALNYTLVSIDIKRSDLPYPQKPGPPNKLIEYPEKELSTIKIQARKEFNARVDEHGRGKNWLIDEPEDHIVKTIDELFLVRGRDSAGDVDRMIQHSANALNHMLMCLEIMLSGQTSEVNRSQQ